MRDDNPDNMTQDERLDWLLGDDSLGGNDLAALPIDDHETIRSAILHSVQVSGVEATAEHWARVLDTVGPIPKAYEDNIRLIFNQTIGECF